MKIDVWLVDSPLKRRIRDSHFGDFTGFIGPVIYVLVTKETFNFR